MSSSEASLSSSSSSSSSSSDAPSAVSVRLRDVDHASTSLRVAISGLTDTQLLSLKQALNAWMDKNPRGIDGYDFSRYRMYIDLAIGAAEEYLLDYPDCPLTEDEIAAIHIYSQETLPSLCGCLNTLLRKESRELLKPFFPYLKLLLTALYKLPLVRATVYRGVDFDITNVVNENQKPLYIPKRKLFWWAFSSTTTDISVTESFLRQGDRTLFVIDGVGVNIKPFSAVKREDEVLLLPGTEVQIQNILSAPPVFIINMKQTLNPPPLDFAHPGLLSLNQTPVPGPANMSSPLSATVEAEVAAMKAKMEALELKNAQLERAVADAAQKAAAAAALDAQRIKEEKERAAAAQTVVPASSSSSSSSLASSSAGSIATSLASFIGGPILNGHTNGVTSVCITADGRYILSGSYDNTVTVWDAATWKLVKILEGHTNSVLSVCATSDNRYILSGSYDNTVRVWNAATWKELAKLEEDTDGVCSVCATADNRYIICGSCDNTVRVWDAATWKLVAVLEGHTSTVSSVCVTADSRYVISGSRDSTVRVWDAATWKLMKVLEGHTNWVYSVCVTADSRYIFSGGSDNAVRVWNVATWKEVAKLEGHTNSVWSVCATADSRYIISGSRDNTVRVWNAATWKEVAKFEGHTDCVNSVCATADNRYIISGSWDNTVRAWNVAI